jgi:hypothetical protein
VCVLPAGLGETGRLHDSQDCLVAAIPVPLPLAVPPLVACCVLPAVVLLPGQKYHPLAAGVPLLPLLAPLWLLLLALPFLEGGPPPEALTDAAWARPLPGVLDPVLWALPFLILPLTPLLTPLSLVPLPLAGDAGLLPQNQPAFCCC